MSKGENKFPRIISIPTIRDRLTLRSLCNLLSDTYRNDLSIEIAQAKIDYVNKAIKEKRYTAYIKIDVKNFYPSINHEVLIKKLQRKIRKKEIINLIKKAITNNNVTKSKKETQHPNHTGVPQGLSISNILAEIYISDIDKKYQKRDDLFYTRYVDDILVFCNENDVKSIFEDLKKSINKECLEIHELNEDGSKCQLGDINDEIHFLGYKYKDRTSSIIERNREKFEDSIASIFTAYKYRFDNAKNESERINTTNVLEWRLNLKITGCIFKNQKRGWMFYFSQIEDIYSLYKIDLAIKKMASIFCKRELKIKSLVKTYHETKRLKASSHKYIVNFDKLSISEKRDILERYLGYKSLSSASDERIEHFFNMRISHIIKELEQDIGDVS
ncbi:reverse transcriptase domain-containing protein [Thiothrix subterranea]|uniref:reverse transcriptase domain-containing protein n=1 Tax=Thiothrix subterranea TaxID=2735563 RepID=UPI001D180658|nr:reverse transcriptase domain-containing protein [Thiothrix subterranea]